MILIIIAVIIAVFLIISFLPIWGIKWKYTDPSKATVHQSGDHSNVPKGWMFSDDVGLPLWALSFGTVSGVKEAQSYAKVYSRGSNIKYRIGLSVFK